MCGLIALLGNLCSRDGVLTATTDVIRHRGPDDEGHQWFALRAGRLEALAHPEPDAIVGLGHRRLAILDLSAAGHQPMAYPSKRGPFWIVYNGEVYNFVELRSELTQLGHSFNSGSDTEVILAAYAEWGTDAFARFNGMWALALLDMNRGKIVISRDRLGIKPLYQWSSPEALAIISEPKQLTRLPGVKLRADGVAVAEYAQTGYENTDRTFFTDVRPVPAGTWAEVDVASRRTGPFVSYWEIEKQRSERWSRTDAARAFSEQFSRAVKWQLRSDVPIGCALSGGLDSSAVACEIQAQRRASENGAQPLKAFTASFPGDSRDEHPFARLVAEHIGAEAHLAFPKPIEFLSELDEVLWMHDEPIGSTAMYGAYCLARITREAGVPVTLNGQGGDEILGGYWQTYLAYLVGEARHARWATIARHMLGAPFGGNTALWAQLAPMLQRFRHRRRPTLELRKHVATDGPRRVSSLLRMEERERRIYEIRELHLPRLLKWDDRNFMAFSVEGRYPFLDHQLIELCLSFPPSVLYRRGWTKQPLRDGLAGRLPDAIVYRKTKWGFVTPQHGWLQGALRNAISSFLADDSPVWDTVDRSSARALAESALGPNGSEVESQTIFRLFVLDRWFRTFELS